MLNFFDTNSFRPLVFGSGERAIVCFHGFGQSPKVYSSLFGKKRHCTVYSFYLPNLSNPQSLIYQQPNYFEKYIEGFQAFLVNHSIGQFEIVAFSIGAKVALSLAVPFSEQISHITLLAPDGVAKRPVYQLATNTLLGRVLFKAVTQHFYPIVQYSVAVGVGLRLVPRSLLRVISYYANPTRRILIFTTWLNCRYFSPNLAVLKSKLSGKATLELVLASTDNLIKPKHVKPLEDFFPSTEQKILPTTHEKLILAWINAIK